MGEICGNGSYERRDVGWCSGGLWGSAVCGGSLGDLTLQMRVGGREGGVWECVGGLGRRGGKYGIQRGCNGVQFSMAPAAPTPCPLPPQCCGL